MHKVKPVEYQDWDKQSGGSPIDDFSAGLWQKVPHDTRPKHWLQTKYFKPPVQIDGKHPYDKDVPGLFWSLALSLFVAGAVECLCRMLDIVVSYTWRYCFLMTTSSQKHYHFQTACYFSFSVDSTYSEWQARRGDEQLVPLGCVNLNEMKQEYIKVWVRGQLNLVVK